MKYILLILMLFLCGCATSLDFTLEMKIKCDDQATGFSDMNYKELKIYIVGGKCDVISLEEVN